jgi:hypothetical protein
MEWDDSMTYNPPSPMELQLSGWLAGHMAFAADVRSGCWLLLVA